MVVQLRERTSLSAHEPRRQQAFPPITIPGSRAALGEGDASSRRVLSAAGLRGRARLVSGGAVVCPQSFRAPKAASAPATRPNYASFESALHHAAARAHSGAAGEESGRSDRMRTASRIKSTEGGKKARQMRAWENRE